LLFEFLKAPIRLSSKFDFPFPIGTSTEFRVNVDQIASRIESDEFIGQSSVNNSERFCRASF